MADAPLRIVEHTPAYWQVTFDNPPINLFGPETYAQMRLLMDRLETDEHVRVVVFDSANPDYFIAHFDMERGFEVPDVPGAARIADDWHNFVVRLAKVPVVSIAAVRGRTRGIGSEFSLACDIRFASREKAIFGQPEVGVGVIPGGGGTEWLPRLVGRSRALEIALSSDDFDGTTAELYGLVNRAIPDADFDHFVDTFARRIAGFDRQPLAEVKRIINERAGLPTEADIEASQAVFLAATAWPKTQTRLATITKRGLQQDSDIELRLGHHVTTLNTTEN
jgi:enoyl-CoA hydratase/carnithine racemase